MLLQVYIYITFSEAQLISEAIENVFFVCGVAGGILAFHDYFACFTLTFSSFARAWA